MPLPSCLDSLLRMGHSAATHPGRALSPLSSQPEESWAKGPPKVMKNGSCSATTVAGSAALPFVTSTGAQRSGEICGSTVFPGNVISTGGVMGQRPTKVMKNGSCSATTVVGSAVLPFVISTGAPKERSGEIGRAHV